MPEQPLAYLLPEELQAYLIKQGHFTEMNVPNLDELEDFLYALEGSVDAWMGFRLAATEYQEQRISNANHLILLGRYPVIEIKSVQWILPYLSNKPMEYINIDTLWRGGRTVFVPTAGDNYQISYVAGCIELPAQLKRCLLNLIKKMLQEHSGAIDAGILESFSNTPSRDLTSVNLPGGISQTFRVGEVGKDAARQGVGSTELDRVFLPLLRLGLRRQTVT